MLERHPRLHYERPHQVFLGCVHFMLIARMRLDSAFPAGRAGAVGLCRQPSRFVYILPRDQGTTVTPCPVAPPRLLRKLTLAMEAIVVWKE